MFVALSNGVMLLSELIIIYLAAAAPFGVAAFLQRRGDVSRSHSLGHAAGAALLWPLTLLSRPLNGTAFFSRQPDAPEQKASVSRESGIEGAQRALLSALYQTEDLARDFPGTNPEATRESVGSVIASVECYVGLSLAAVAGASEEGSPRELELCRIAGREDEDDLLIAGRCHQRRHLARLKAHQTESRLELLHALAVLREVCERTRHATTTDRQAVHQLFATLLEAYTRAIEILSLFGDERAARRVARLLDATSARLRHEEAQRTQVAPELLLQQNTTGNPARKDESCPTSIPHPMTTAPQPSLSATPTTSRARG
jgi:hypothetical protein